MRDSLGIAQGDEWGPYAGLEQAAATRLREFLELSKSTQGLRDLQAEPRLAPVHLSAPTGAEQSTQSAFGRILHDLAKSRDPIADRIITTSPDVTVSTNLGACMQAEGGGAVYLRLTTRTIPQPVRDDDAWAANAVSGGYWLERPGPDAEMAIAFTGAVAPEATAAWEALADDFPGLGLLNVTSPDRLHRGWGARQAQRWSGGRREPSHVETLLGELPRDAGPVTIIDGAPDALSWLGGVRGMRVSALGIDRFGQTGDLPDLYRDYRLDSDAIIDAAAELVLD